MSQTTCQIEISQVGVDIKISRDIHLNKILEELKNKPRWNISINQNTPDMKNHEQQYIPQIFKRIKNPHQTIYLWLQKNQMPEMCKLVTIPQFSNAKILCLGANRILSLQILAQAQMQQLQQLWLWNNLLTRIDVLRKMYVPRLTYLDISKNFITELPKFSELCSFNLQTINLDKTNLSCIDHFIKNIQIDDGQYRTIHLLQTKLVKVFNCIVNKNKQKGRIYHFAKRKLDYI